MAARNENAFEVLSREEAAPEVEKPALQVTQEDVEKGTARAEAKGAVLAPAGSPSPPAAVRSAAGGTRRELGTGGGRSATPAVQGVARIGHNWSKPPCSSLI